MNFLSQTQELSHCTDVIAHIFTLHEQMPLGMHLCGGQSLLKRPTYKTAAVKSTQSITKQKTYSLVLDIMLSLPAKDFHQVIKESYY